MTFQLPPRKKPAKGAFSTEPEAVKHWVGELPLANPEATRQHLDAALEELNGLELPAKARLDTLEAMLPAVTLVLQALKRTYLEKSGPLDAAHERKSAACQGLCRRMITGYEIVAEGKDNGALVRGAVTVAVYRALHFLGEALLNNYQTYIQYPQGTWREIHALYAIAEELGVTARPVTDDSSGKPVISAVDRRYRQILLLSLACPYQLRQNEIKLVNDALADWSDHCRLSGTDDAGNRGLFAVNLDADNPPSYRALAGNDAGESQMRVLDTTQLRERLQELLETQAAATTGATGISDLRTLQRLMLSWGVMPRRRFARQRHEEAIKMVVGLNAVHGMVRGNDTEEKPPQSEEAAAETLADPTIPTTTQIFTTPMSGNPFEAAMRARREATRGAALASAPGDANMESWKVADMSAGGYCLLHDSEDASRARIGELVAIANSRDRETGNWHLGVVRWMKFSADRGLELGIQMLSPGAEAINASLEDTDDSDRYNAILMPGIKAIGTQPALILPVLPFRTGKSVHFGHDSRQRTALLERQLENTGSFAQYHFSEK